MDIRGMQRILDSRINAAIDEFLYRLSVYAVPVAVGLASLAALLLLPNQYPLQGASRIEFAVLEQIGRASCRERV